MENDENAVLISFRKCVDIKYLSHIRELKQLQGSI